MSKAGWRHTQSSHWTPYGHSNGFSCFCKFLKIPTTTSKILTECHPLLKLLCCFCLLLRTLLRSNNLLQFQNPPSSNESSHHPLKLDDTTEFVASNILLHVFQLPYNSVACFRRSQLLPAQESTNAGLDLHCCSVQDWAHPHSLCNREVVCNLPMPPSDYLDASTYPVSNKLSGGSVKTLGSPSILYPACAVIPGLLVLLHCRLLQRRDRHIVD